MAYITVTTPFDVVAPGDGQLSLREALTLANGSSGSDTIRFTAAVVGQTLVLTGGELSITNDLVIDGNNGGAAPQTTIDANYESRVLSISGGGTEATLKGLIITHGRSEQSGGGIFLGSDAGLATIDSTIAGNSTSSGDYSSSSNRLDGGGIFADNASRLMLDRTVVANNFVPAYGAYGRGGGIAVESAQAVATRNSVISDNSGAGGGGIHLHNVPESTIEDTIISRNSAWDRTGNTYGGGLAIIDSTISISRSMLDRNSAGTGGGIHFAKANMTIVDSAIISNGAYWGHGSYAGAGGGIAGSGSLVIRSSTITGNSAGGFYANSGYGGGIFAPKMDIANSIVSGNFAEGNYSGGPDITGTISLSNGHNVFGSDVAGNIAGDRENVAPGVIFATLDPNTGGGKLGPDGTVALRNNVGNPALSAGDPLAANIFDQRGAARPQPAGSLPDLGAFELNQALSTGATANNDVRSGTNAVNSLTGAAGNDYLAGLGGNDTLDGGDGSDFLDGGPGNDKLIGGTGLDLVSYAGDVAVVVDLSGTTDTAKRGSETDTLIGIEGALGSKKNDTFKGDALNNEFQGKAGKDTMTGGGGRDTWDFNDVADSPAGATRDVVTDFAPGQDVIDLAGVDADSTVPGNQSFRWVGKAVLTGAAQLGYYTTGGMTIVRASTDADAAAEMEIQLTGLKALTKYDFRP